MKKFVIIVAGGSGKRMNSDTPKQFLLLKGKPLLMHTIDRFFKYDSTINIILVLPSSHIEEWSKLCSQHAYTTIHKIVNGGIERFFSVQNALTDIKEDGLVAVHDGVRPLVSEETISRCFDIASKNNNAIPYMDIVESIRCVGKNETFPVDRNLYKTIQTPQIFSTKILKEAYQQSYSVEFTDDASVVEKLGEKINLVEGNKENIKITTPFDLQIAELLLK